MDPITLSLIGGTIAGALGLWSSHRQSKKNRELQEKQNQQDRAFQMQMYDKLRKDNLADFHLANQYNHPLQQMNRLRQAGLNPNLVYGKGAETTAAQIKGSSFTPQKQEAPQSTFDPSLFGSLQSALSMPYELKLKQAQTDNLHQTSENLKVDEGYKRALTLRTLTEDARGKFDLQLVNDLRSNTIESSLLDTEIKKANLQFTLNQDERSFFDLELRKAKNTAEIKKIGEDILTSRLHRLHERLKMEQTRQSTAKTSLEQLKILAEIDVVKQNLELLKQTENIRDLEEYYAEIGVPLNSPNPIGFLDRTFGRTIDKKFPYNPKEFKPLRKRIKY